MVVALMTPLSSTLMYFQLLGNLLDQPLFAWTVWLRFQLLLL